MICNNILMTGIKICLQISEIIATPAGRKMSNSLLLIQRELSEVQKRMLVETEEYKALNT